MPKPQNATASQAQDPAANGQQPGKVLNGRWRQRTTTPPLTDAPLAGTTANLETSPETPPAKSTKSPRKYGPVELFPKAKDSDRTGNPFSFRKPVLAW